MTQPAARALLLLPALLGCDIVQGFQDAGNALFPEQSTHLSTPALRLVSGGYSRIDLASGRELSVLARSVDSDASLFVMPFANPQPCEIPDVGRYVASRNPNRTQAGIAYFHDDVAQGTLHFADTSCRTFDLEIAEASLPVGETEHTVIVWAAGELLEVDPEKNKRTTLSPAVTNLITRAFSGRTLVRTADQLEVFGTDWKSHGTFGRAVGSVIKTKSTVLYVDATGLRRLSGADANATKDELLVEDACDLGIRDDTWATFHAPCADGSLHAFNIRSGKVYDLELDADPLYLRLFPASGSPGKDPNHDPFWFVFLRDVSSGLGTFVVKDPHGVEHVIGESATLDHSEIVESDSENHGYAVVNVASNIGDYAYFDAKGVTHTLANNVLARAGRLVVDWNGDTGNLAVASGDRLVVVAEGVPSKGFEFTDQSKEWTVVFHDLEGDHGRLSRFAGTLDSVAKTPVDAPFRRPELDQVAPSVGLSTTASLGGLIPGTIFLADYAVGTDTGQLTYENAELRFKATVASGVSDYLITSSNLLYSIPYGNDRGIWLATGK